MRQLNRKISLNPFKCKTPNTLVSLSGNTIITYNDWGLNGNFNCYPCDILVPYSFSDDGINYDFSSIIEFGNKDINIPTEKILTNISNRNYYKLLYKNGEISYDSGGTYNRYMTYYKLHDWFVFYKKYFNLLHDTVCDDISNKVYISAVDYFYSNKDRLDNDLSYYENLDNIFVNRGGIIKDTNKNNVTHCDFYDWLNNYVFLIYDLKKCSGETDNGETISLKEIAKEWKSTVLNIPSLKKWYSWFLPRHEYYSAVTDCSQVKEDLSSDKSCCDCQEYQRLGGNIMYRFLKKCIGEVERKANIIANYSTYSASFSIPFLFSNSYKDVGEGSILVENWEGGTDYSVDTNTIYSGGTTVRYGGDNFVNNEDTSTMSVQDSVFISDSGSGYDLTKYKEFQFIKNKKSLYKEYLPSYIKKNLKEFKLDDNENVTSYAYLNNKFIKNPTVYNMSTVYNIETVSSANTHFFYINDKLYESKLEYILLDYNGNVASDTNGISPIIVYFLNAETKQNPYVYYKGKTYYGHSYGNTNRFTFKQIPKHKEDWFSISTSKKEVLEYNSILYYIENNCLSITNNETKYSYHSIYGYVVLNEMIENSYNNGNYCLINNGKIVKTTPSTSVNNNVVRITYDIEEDNIFGEFLSNPTSWEKSSDAYWVDISKNLLYYIKPFTEYTLGFVKGNAKSRLEELKDFKVTHDKLGNSLKGIYCGNNTVPNDTDTLDLPYHVGNVNNITPILTEAGTEEICPSITSNKISYYWGNILTDIAFYFRDTSGNVITKTEREVPHKYTTSDIVNSIKNLDYIKKSIYSYLINYKECKKVGSEASLTSLTCDVEELIVVGNNEDNYKVYKVSDVNIEYDSDNNVIKKYKDGTCLSNLSDIILNLEDSVYCNIDYSFGAIIKRPVYEGSKYSYGNYELTTNYHSGVCYSEVFTIGIENSTFYYDYETFYNIPSLVLNSINTCSYSLDNVVDEDSDIFTANQATFKVETNYDMTTNSVNYPSGGKVKYSTEINSTESDGRQFNFYNGFMAAPSIVEEYNLGISSLRNVNDNIYINRGVNKVFDKHLKLLEVKSFEALEQYNNGFFNIIDSNS